VGHPRTDAVTDAVVDRSRNACSKAWAYRAALRPLFENLQTAVGNRLFLRWRVQEKKRLWVCNPGHPIAAGSIVTSSCRNEEMYGRALVPSPPPEEQISSRG